MKHLRYHIRATLEFYNGLDLLNSLGLTVIEDREKLDGVNTSVVREHFKSWVETAPQREQGKAQVHIQSGFQIWESQRYLYCIQVDAEFWSLSSTKQKRHRQTTPATQALSRLYRDTGARMEREIGIHHRSRFKGAQRMMSVG
jgi:hypothetical protein